MTLDGTPLRVRSFTARLPALDWTRPHIIAAEMIFDDGAVARRELVLNGGFSASVGAELTPILVTQQSAQAIGTLDGCFSADGVELRTASVETRRETASPSRALAASPAVACTLKYGVPTRWPVLRRRRKSAGFTMRAACGKRAPLIAGDSVLKTRSRVATERA
jgi:hypothetical protein